MKHQQKNDMEDNEDVPTEDGDADLEDQQVQAIVRKILPPVREVKNVSKALLRLSSVRVTLRLSAAGTDLLTTALKAGASRFRLAEARNERLIAELAELPGRQSAIGITVAERQIDEQRRIDQLVFEAIDRVQDAVHSIPSEEGKAEEGKDEIDDDWIESFRREAADRSQGEMRETFVRILAGEIREPGTFSIRAVRTVGDLSQSTATLFRRAASLRVGVEALVSQGDSAPRFQVLDARIPALDGQLGQSHLRDEGLGYDRLIELTENGLLHPDYGSHYPYALVIQPPKVRQDLAPLLPVFIHQDQKWRFIPSSTFQAGSDLQIEGAQFTAVGKELLGIVDIERDAAFLDKVRTYLKGQHIEMVPFPSRTP